MALPLAAAAADRLPISSGDLQLKILASEDERRRLQDQIFVLRDRLRDSDRRLDQCRAEAAMSAQGLRRCAEDKEAMVSGYADLVDRRGELENECELYQRDIEKIREICDDMEKDNAELRASLQKNGSKALVREVKSLQKDKENLRVNLNKAEEEVKVLFEENRILDEENKRLLMQLNRDNDIQGSGNKISVSASAKGKRKSGPKECNPGRAIDFKVADTSRLPQSPLHLSSPESRTCQGSPRAVHV